MKPLDIDLNYAVSTLLRLVEIPSPSGYTDRVVHFIGEELERLGIPFELTRRGAIRADLKGDQSSPDRAIVSHLDTLGAMVRNFKDNGRLLITPIGHWSARFAEGARVTIFTGDGARRGTILPFKASGHTYNEEIDTQPVSWDNLEVRVDLDVSSVDALHRAGFHIGDFIAIDPNPEVTDAGFINSRHLDDKAGVAAVLAAARAVTESKVRLPVDCHLLFTISEEVGVGASAVLHGDVAELVSIDNATPAPGQNSSEFDVVLAMKDSSGPFDYHLTQKLLRLCREFDIPHRRDVFRYYRSDAASAVEAGNDVRVALACFGVDGSHGYERTHASSLQSLARLLAVYMQSPPTFERDRSLLGPLKGFPTQPFDRADEESPLDIDKVRDQLKSE